MDVFDAIAAGHVPPPSPSQAPTASDMTDAELNVSYKLARHVPDMERGFTIQTSYGEILITNQRLARRIQALVRNALVTELAVLERPRSVRGAV